MRIGAEFDDQYEDPAFWIAALKERNYDAAIFPLRGCPPSETIRAFAAAANEAGILIAEVGTWSNPLHPDPATRRQKIELCAGRLAVADEAGARCCVNVAGSRGEEWLWPHPANFDADTFDLVVTTVREIVDTVKPTRTYYALETMPWMIPSSPAEYLRLLTAIDRPRVGVHIDIANMMNCPERYLANGAFIRKCFNLLGPRVQSCHAKDVIMERALSVVIRQVPPGKGSLDYATYLRCISSLDRDIPLILEEFGDSAHQSSAAYLRSLAARIGLDR